MTGAELQEALRINASGDRGLLQVSGIHYVKDMTKANWLAWAGELRTNAVALHEAAAGKNEAKTRQALETLGKTCTKCHDVFR